MEPDCQAYVRVDAFVYAQFCVLFISDNTVSIWTFFIAVE